jgi:hypothetical protein
MTTADLDDVIAAIAELPEAARVELVKAALRLAQYAAGELSRESMARLAKDPTGRLARSFLARVVEGDTITAEAYSSMPYAAIHDRGGEIKAKRTKYLAIPIRKGAGKPGRGQGPRDFNRPLFPVRARSGAMLLMERVGKGKRQKMVPRYLLKQSVRIPGVGYLDAAAKTLLEQVGITAERVADKLALQVVSSG